MLIGLFVIIGFVVLVGSMLWLGASKFFEERKVYVTYFDGAVGLEKGSPVKYQGVPVGSVDKIDLAPDNRLIEVQMIINRNIAINDSLRVKLAIAGVAGGQFLQLQYAENYTILNSYPQISFDIPKDAISYIKSSPSDIEEIALATKDVINNLRLLEVERISENTNRVLIETSQFLDTATQFFNQDNLYSIIDNLNEATVSLKIFMNRAEQSPVINDVRDAANNLYMTSQYLKNFSTKLNEQIDSMNLVTRMDNTFEAYDTVMYTLNSSVNQITYRTEDLILSLNETLEQLRVTNRELRKTVRNISDNPGVLLTEPPKKKE